MFGKELIGLTQPGLTPRSLKTLGVNTIDCINHFNTHASY